MTRKNKQKFYEHLTFFSPQEANLFFSFSNLSSLRHIMTFEESMLQQHGIQLPSSILTKKKCLILFEVFRGCWIPFTIKLSIMMCK